MAVSADLYEVLAILHAAGGRQVSADDLDWSTDMAATVFHALNMLYMVRHDTEEGVFFSLTASGYRALGEKPPGFMSIGDAWRSLFRVTGGPLD